MLLLQTRLLKKKFAPVVASSGEDELNELQDERMNVVDQEVDD